MALIAASDKDLWTVEPGRRQVDAPSTGLSVATERADAVQELLAERVRCTGELATSEVAENKLRAAAKTASANTPDVLPPPFAAGADTMAELLALTAQAPGHVERINVLRRDVRHRQQAIANLRGLFKKRKARTQTEFLDQVKTELEMERNRLGMCEQRGLLAARQLRRALHHDVARTRNDVTDLDRSMATENDLPWNLARWESWRAVGCTKTAELRVGQFRENSTGEMLDIPLVVPFVGTGRPIVIVSEGDAQHQQASALMQSFIMRTLAMFPQQAKYTLLDPSGNGLAFPMARSVPKETSGTGDVRRDLDEVTREIQRIIRTYLDPSRPTFEDIPDEMRLAESYHFVFVADFPNGYDLRGRSVADHRQDGCQGRCVRVRARQQGSGTSGARRVRSLWH